MALSDGSRLALSSIVLLALLLMFGSEILVWTNPAGRPMLEWLLLIPGYAALSAILLDFTVRYRVRDVFGALVLTGIYSLAGALILNPASTLVDVPRSLVTRVLGAHGLIAAEMIGLFLAITSHKPNRRNLLIGCAVVGLAWGIWVKNWPPDEGYGTVSLVTMFAFAGGGLGLIGLFLYGVLPRLQSNFSNAITGDEALNVLLLSRRGWLITSGIVIALLIVRGLQGSIINAGLILCPLLLVLCWAIMWFRGRKRGDTLLDQHVPIQPIPLAGFLLSALIFLGVAIGGYNLPAIQAGTVTPYLLIGLGFTAYGLAWLPTVSLVLGIQGYLRQLATRQM